MKRETAPISCLHVRFRGASRTRHKPSPRGKVGTPERMRPGRKGLSDGFGKAIIYKDSEISDKSAKTDYDAYFLSPPLPPRYASLRGPLPSPGGTAFLGADRLLLAV